MTTPVIPSATPFLDRIGMNKEEQSVYLALLALGPLTAGEIAKYTKIKPLSKIRKILASLFSKGYAYNVEGLEDKAVGLYPFRDFAEEAEKDAQKIEQLAAELKQYVANQLKHFDEVMRSTEEHVRTESAKNSEKVTQNSEETRTIVDAKLAEATNTVSTTSDASKKKVKTSADTFLKNQTETTISFENSLNDNLNSLSSDLKGKTNSYTTAMIGRLNEHKESLDTTLADFAKNVADKSSALASESSSKIANDTEALQGSISELKSKTEANLQEMGGSIEARNTEFLSGGKEVLTMTNNSIASKTDALASDLKNDSKERLEGTRDHLIAGLKTFVTDSGGNVTTLKENLDGSIEKLSENLKTTTEETKSNRTELNNQFKTAIAANLESMRTDFEKEVQSIGEKFNSKVQAIAGEFKEKIEELISSASGEINLLCNEIHTSFTELINKHKEEITTNIDNDNKAVEEGTAAMFVKIGEHSSESLSAIATAAENINSSITTLKDNYDTAIKTKIKETISSMHGKIDSSAEEVKSDYNSATMTVSGELELVTTANSARAKETATATIQTVHTKMDSKSEGLTNLLSALDKSITQTAKKITDQANSIKETACESIASETLAMTTAANEHKDGLNANVDTIVNTSKESFVESKEAFLDETKKTKQKIARDSTNSITKMTETAIGALDDMANQTKTAIRNNEETSLGAISDIAKVVETSVRKEINAVKGGFNDYYERFANDSNVISSLMATFKSQNEAFHETMITYPHPRIEIALLYSKEAIFHRLSDMLQKRIKSNVTMVIPDPTDIPTTILGKVKPQAKMTVISKIDEVSNKSIIDDIRAEDALGRAKIRKIGLQDMLGFSEYIAFDRDGGEEMLIAFKTTDQKDWIGVLSIADGFKNVVIGETLGRQALSISRELK